MERRLTFTRAALAEVDRRAVEEYGIPVLALMENAGRCVADAAIRRLAGVAPPREAIILCGPGNNGGDGLVAARHLHNAGLRITILLLAERHRFRDAAAINLAIADRMKLAGGIATISPGHAELRDALVEATPDVLLIDALFGTGLSRPVEGLAAEVILAMNASRKPILAVDVPSGMDADTGLPAAGGAAEYVIHATETVSMCGLKTGFTAGKTFVGKIVVGAIGVPRELLEDVVTKT